MVDEQATMEALAQEANEKLVPPQTGSITFSFMGGTMAGQNVTECSYCFSLVLSGSVDGHRARHEEEWARGAAVSGGGTESVRGVGDGHDEQSAVLPAEGEVPDGVRTGGATNRGGRKRVQNPA